MTASDEWEEMHLTLDGWVNGSLQYDSTGCIRVEWPSDRVLSVKKSVCHVTKGDASSDAVTQEIFFCHDDKDLVINVLIRHGSPRFSV